MTQNRGRSARGGGAADLRARAMRSLPWLPGDGMPGGDGCLRVS